MEKRVTAVLVAAGSSTRMGFDKLSFDLGGETVVQRSIRAFAECPLVDEIVLVAGKNREFLEQQAEKGKAVEVPENSFDVYDLAALAYLYKRIKENDPVREASHVVIDEAQDFGMMAYQVLHYCLRDCTYTIMGDTSQNIHFSYGLNLSLIHI